jgi:hypothetical protein
MRASQEFPGGITNGAQWYVVKGGMQDWSYFWHKDLQITIEVSETKWPNYSEIPTFYRNNRDSMIHFMKQTHRGAGFNIRRPNVSGVVQVQRLSPSPKNLGNFAFNKSQFYKVMPEGDYAFTIVETNPARRTPHRVSVRINGRINKSNGNYLQLP